MLADAAPADSLSVRSVAGAGSKTEMRAESFKRPPAFAERVPDCCKVRARTERMELP